MDDHTRGDEPGQAAGDDAPLRRDRKALRSNPKPLWSRPSKKTAPARDSGNAPVDPAEPRDRPHPEAEFSEPEFSELESHDEGLNAAEQLFAGAWPAPEPQTLSTPTGPVTAAPEVEELPTTDGAAKKRGFSWGRRTAAEPAGDLESDSSDTSDTSDSFAEPVAAAVSVPSPQAYIPPGGFAGSGHPKLGPIEPEPLPSYRGLAGLDVAALVTAVILPPIGLILAIVALVRGKQVRGWASDLARAAVAVSLAMTVVFAGVGGYSWFTATENAKHLAAVKADQRAHALIETTSIPFCNLLAEHPTIYSTADPDYGWPAVDAPGGYNKAISEYSKVWAQIAEVAPAGIEEETAAIAARVAGIVEITNALGNQNRAGDLLGLHEKDDLATVESWYVEYCNAPEPTETAEEPAE